MNFKRLTFTDSSAMPPNQRYHPVIHGKLKQKKRDKQTTTKSSKLNSSCVFVSQLRILSLSLPPSSTIVCKEWHTWQDWLLCKSPYCVCVSTCLKNPLCAQLLSSIVLAKNQSFGCTLAQWQALLIPQRQTVIGGMMLMERVVGR